VSWTNFDLVEVRKVGDECGVFARQGIPPGTVVGVFDGVAEVFSIDERGAVDWRGHDGGWSIHLKLHDRKLYTIMPNPNQNVNGIDFINHSCRPNCRADAGVLVVETTRFISKNEQLTLNYHQMDLIKLGRTCWCKDVAEEQRCIL
jgi:uncharacterized protein